MLVSAVLVGSGVQRGPIHSDPKCRHVGNDNDARGFAIKREWAPSKVEQAEDIPGKYGHGHEEWDGQQDHQSAHQKNAESRAAGEVVHDIVDSAGEKMGAKEYAPDEENQQHYNDYDEELSKAPH